MEALKRLKAEIAAKKANLEEKNLVSEEKKYFKRGDLSEIEHQEYLEHHREHLKDQQGDIKGTRQEESDEGQMEEGASGEQETKMLHRDEAIRRLRERGEPIRFFGESDYESWQRLKKLEILEPEVNKGARNDFKEAMDRVDLAYLNEIAQSDPSQAQVAGLDDGITLDELMHAKDDMNMGNDDFDVDAIIKYCKFVLTLWRQQLLQLSEVEKRSMTGKLQSATHTQTVAYMKPLFRKLKRRTIPADIKDSLTKIIKRLLDRDYLRANDDYVEIAIGNAPWPIGVTMVGIHSRTGREKIGSKNVAHVLNDETQRKYFQGLKRVMTKAQELFPTDPSRSVDYSNTMKNF